MRFHSWSKTFSTTLCGLFSLSQFPVTAMEHAALSQFSPAMLSPTYLVQRNCDREVQFNTDNNKLALPLQEANLDKKLPVACTWYNIRPSAPITEDAGMQITTWLQNDPANPIKYTNDNKLNRINLHCVFEPSTNGLGGKRKLHRTESGVDFISGVMVSKSGAIKPPTSSSYKDVPFVNGNAPGNSLSSASIALERDKYTITDSADPAHPFNQEIDIHDLPNYGTFWDTQTDPSSAHPGYSQVNIIFLLNGEYPGTNRENIWYGSQVFNDGDKLTCDVWLPDHYQKAQK